MEGSGWLGMDPSGCWSGMESSWSEMPNSWNPMMVAMMGGGPGGMSGGRGAGQDGSMAAWNVDRGGGGVNGSSGGGGGGNDWPVMSTGWTDPVGFGADKDDEWGVPANWGIDPPPGYPQNLLMDDSGFEGLGGMFMGGDIGNFIMGGVGGCGFPRGSGPTGSPVVGNGVNGGGNSSGGGGGGSGEVSGVGGSSGGLETDPIDFDIDGLLSTGAHDPMGSGPGGSGSASGNGAVGVGGNGSGGMFGMPGMMSGAGSSSDWCQGLTCCLQQGGGGGYPFI